MSALAHTDQPGLHLPHRVVQRISGPISMYYLRPSIPSPFFGQSRANRPLIMLWGDQHNDDTGMCEKCDPSPECRRIYDKAFLKELDQLAVEYPVDFYTEFSSSFPDVPNPKNILFRRFLQDTTAACHQKTMRNRPRYIEECPTKHIRWHYADPRYMNHAAERYLTSPVVAAYHHPWIHRSPERMTLAKLTSMHLSPEEELHVITRLLYDARNEGYAVTGIREIDEVSYGVLERAREDMMIALLADADRGIPYINDLDNRVHPKYIQLFEPYVSRCLANESAMGTPSIILKQLRKLGLPLNEQEIVHFLAQHYVLSQDPRYLQETDEYLTTTPASVKAFLRAFILDDESGDLERATEQILHELGDSSAEVVWNYLDVFYLRWFALRNYFVDIYTLLRMMKPPQESSSPYLVFGYFGDDHIESMVRMLTGSMSHFLYVPVFYRPPTNHAQGLRCVSITKPILLRADLERHAAAILSANQEHAVALQKYRNILRREEIGRQGGPSLWTPAAAATPMGSSGRGGRRGGKGTRNQRRRKTHKKK